ncbi:ribosome-binding factor A [Acidiferrimicrobium sp. IK]|uniref:ribosome-binding factor A n=1 Tax=Acidiferrimicrobium sp. IK TaxID=2871700 RepID=UPI0021CB84D7|nr:ribosome-binding factor A [Acidiferrimicrobium sp. IK]MCU4183743.1 ribosome-binding factor A [Acidiferrimicrobium sp. IK]
MARVNETLREILAEAISRLGDTDERLTMATVTAVDCAADFGAATVLMSSLDPEEAQALEEARIKLQGEVARQVRLKRTPLLRFAADPAVAAGQRIEDLLRDIGPLPDDPPEDLADVDASERGEEDASGGGEAAGSGGGEADSSGGGEADVCNRVEADRPEGLPE